ncbi:MAG: sugar ABC transporter permease [Treponema sp.]|jgi:ABC-type sugar transport system permease subunit|nr:sugar ABC transporter permease [Treponema sp.]
MARIEGKKLKLTLKDKNAVTGLLLLIPFLFGFVMFMAVPLVQSLAMAFSSVTIDSPNHRFVLSFSGLENFNRVFRVDTTFNRLLVEETARMLAEVPAEIIFSIFIALLLNQNFRGRGLVRAIFFLPVILSSGVIIKIEMAAQLLEQMMNAAREDFPVNTSLVWLLQEIFSSGSIYMAVFFEYVIRVVQEIYTVAMASGVQIIIFLSALQTIPESMYEAAKIEGSTSWECFWKITFPLLTPLILVNVVYSVVDFFLRTDNRMMGKLESTTRALNYGFSSAMAWVYFLSVMLILGAAVALISRKVHYDV